MIKFVPALLLVLFTGCATPPKLDVSLSLEKQNADLIFVKVKVVNTEDRATVPISIEVTGQAETNGHWEKASTLLQPAALCSTARNSARSPNYGVSQPTPPVPP